MHCLEDFRKNFFKIILTDVSENLTFRKFPAIQYALYINCMYNYIKIMMACIRTYVAKYIIMYIRSYTTFVSLC